MVKGAIIVFELYSEKARRAVFHARLAVSTLGGRVIEPQHLLFGILHESPRSLVSNLDSNALDELIARLETALSRGENKPPTSADVPLSVASQDLLHCAEDERVKLGHSLVEVGHLVLGILRIDDAAKDLLRERGVTAEAVRRRLPSDEADELPQGFSVG